MLLLSLAIAYLLGSIPFGLLITRAAGLGDIRAIGSGNIGATNVMRTGRKGLGVATLLLDAGKGFLAVWIARHLGIEEEWLYAAALAAVLGHVFPLWLKFRGGKGVATAFGVLFALQPGLGLAAGFFWLAGLIFSRYVSVASIEAFWFLAIIPIARGDAQALFFALALAILISWTHRANVNRLKVGTEPRLGKKP